MKSAYQARQIKVTKYGQGRHVVAIAYTDTLEQAYRFLDRLDAKGKIVRAPKPMQATPCQQQQAQHYQYTQDDALRSLGYRSLPPEKLFECSGCHGSGWVASGRGDAEVQCGTCFGKGNVLSRGSEV